MSASDIIVGITTGGLLIGIINISNKILALIRKRQSVYDASRTSILINTKKGKPNRKSININNSNISNDSNNIDFNDKTREPWRIQLNELKDIKHKNGDIIPDKSRWKGLIVNKKEYILPDNNLITSIDAELYKMIKLRHPNLVLFLGICIEEDANDNKILTFINEYMEKGTLYQRLHINHNIKVSWRKRLEIALIIARGMNYLHGTNPATIHGNLSSYTCQFNQGGIIKIADCGWSNLYRKGLKPYNKRQNGSNQAKVGSSDALGGLSVPNDTPREHPLWTAPELINGDIKIATKKCDIYSFGIILYELFHRNVPYPELISNNTEKTSIKTLQAIYNNTYQIKYSSHIPKSYQNLISLCLHIKVII